MVLETEIFLKYWPLLVAGLALFKASMSAAMFRCSCSTENEARPIVHCTMPPLSVRYCT